MYRIFVVEDDAVIASAVQRHLESWGYQVACAVRFDDVLSDFAAFDPQLVLLDISLPFFNGYHWCREIRKVSKVPILFLTSASDDMNLVMAIGSASTLSILVSLRSRPLPQKILIAILRITQIRTIGTTSSVTTSSNDHAIE